MSANPTVNGDTLCDVCSKCRLNRPVKYTIAGWEQVFTLCYDCYQPTRVPSPEQLGLRCVICNEPGDCKYTYQVNFVKVSKRPQAAASVCSLAHLREMQMKYARIVPEGTLTYRCRYCATLLDSSAPLQCSRCKTVRYCNVACQRADWRRHKTDCKE